MAVVILVVLCLVGAISLIVGKSVIEPPFLLLTSFILGFTAICFNIQDWEVTINPNLALYIALCLIAFAVGYRIASFLHVRRRKESDTLGSHYANYRYPSTVLMLLSVVCCLFYVAQLVKGFDGLDDISFVLRTIYDEGVATEGNFFLHQPLIIVIAIAEVSVFEFMMMKFVKHDSRGLIKVLFPLIPFALCALASTDRNIFIRFIVYCWCLWVLFAWQYAGKGIKYILGNSALLVVVAAVVFFALGKAKNYTSDMHRMLGIYAGSGLYNFNLSIDDIDSSQLQYGSATFSCLTQTLNSLGLLPGEFVGARGHTEFLVYKSATGYVYASNIYSAMMPYVDDFGLLGVVIFPFLLGLFYGALYKLVNNRKCGFGWFAYALLIYPLVYFAIQEQFFWRFHLGLVYELGWAFFFFWTSFRGLFLAKVGTRNGMYSAQSGVVPIVESAQVCSESDGS